MTSPVVNVKYFSRAVSVCADIVGTAQTRSHIFSVIVYIVPVAVFINISVTIILFFIFITVFRAGKTRPPFIKII